MLLTEDYIVSKFYQYAGYPKYNRLSKCYSGGCPTCREGASWGKKRRLYYVTRKNLIFCHNCGLSDRPAKWIQKVANLTYGEVLKENSQFQSRVIDITETPIVQETPTKTNQPDLPADSINLFDKNQCEYYKDNPVVREALALIKHRRLDTAVNRPAALYVSLLDKIHKDRLVIPFHDISGKVVHYQTRTIIENKKYPKYLSKLNSEKSLFGINQVSEKLSNIFVTEGPIDAFFVENGVAVAGINEGKGSFFTNKQKEQLNGFPLHEIVWVLDNQYIDSASRKKTIALAKTGQKVFIWPEKFKKYKDFNEMAIGLKINKISTKFILENTFSGVKANLILANQS